MDSKRFQGITTCLLFLVVVTNAQTSIFDVKTFGAKGDGRTDDSQAIGKAWNKACTSPKPSRVLISKGTYIVGSFVFQGPCMASPISVDVQGTLQAPVNPNQLLTKNSWIAFQNLNNLRVFGGGVFDGQGALAWSQNSCAKLKRCSGSLAMNIGITGVTNSVINNITSLNSKLFHMNVLGCNNVTLKKIKIIAPEQSLNTDGIHVGRSTNVNIIDTNIKTGDDCLSFGDGSQQITVERVTCGPGHGISIGSLGKYPNEQPVKGITVKNCTLTNTQNGVRVKTWPASPIGVASDMNFDDIVMKNVGNPILIDQHYCPYNQCKDKIPSRIKISNVMFKNIRGTSTTQTAVKIACSAGVPCQNVAISNVNLKFNGVGGPAVSECSNVKPTIFGNVYPRVCARRASL
ncbi:exopolygalacturonase-like [Humulus lupulus]|uniref:exopolygalacturonase-like n=1 Tax=Humulus lupulus TaxID=3486 RepID=UPI002B4118CF|nr:exopolygalacturonase-like [Humulus lupulus]